MNSKLWQIAGRFYWLFNALFAYLLRITHTQFGRIMKVLVIGSTGRAGKQLVEFALEKGHEVTAFARNIDSYPIEHENLRLCRGDVLYPRLIAEAMEGQEAVLSVIGIRQFRGPITLLSTGISNITQMMEQAGVRRLLTITGAGILQEDPSYLIMDSLSFPPNLQNISQDHLRMYINLRDSKLDWTIVSPAFMHSGKRTQQYLVQPDYYPKNSLNQVSVEDVADFMTDEMVHNQYLQKRVGIAHPK